MKALPKSRREPSKTKVLVSKPSARTKPATKQPRRVKLQKILVPVDFSEWSIRAVDWATDLARQLGGELILIHVVEKFRYPGDMVSPLAGKEFASDEQKALGGKLSELTADSGVPTRSVVRLGRAWVEICKLARDERCDLIVMCKHGSTGMLKALLGSVTEKVVRLAPCDVLTIKPRGKSAR